MTRTTFMTTAALIALTVAAWALLFPAHLLASKGAAVSAAAEVWVREVGVLLLCVAVVALWTRSHADSPTLRASLVGNVVLQLGLLPIEIVAYLNGTITKLSGIVPNSALHLVLALGFGYFALRMKDGGTTQAMAPAA